MKSKMLATAMLMVVMGLATSSMAQTRWRKTHPRRVEVNHRLALQNRRNDHKEDNGKMSGKESARIQREDHRVRMEERGMARKDHGHITKKDQVKLNRQENKISRQIRNH